MARSAYFNAHLGIDTVKRILTGVVTASTLLHFYYDGFIWKVRERSTRQSLGLAGGTADVSLGGFLPRLGLARLEMGGSICAAVKRALVLADASQWFQSSNGEHGL